MSTNILFTIPNLSEGIITKRPSKYCKTPYVGDLILVDETDKNNKNNENNKNDEKNELMVHTPSLGCCGHVENGSTVLITPILLDDKKKKSQSKDGKPHCTHRVMFAIYKETHLGIQCPEQIIGVYPQLAENIAENALIKNNITCLKDIKEYSTQSEILNSRFDFIGVDSNNTLFVMEIKNVPLADYIDMSKEDKKKAIKNKTFHEIVKTKKYNEKIAYFPDGYRKTMKNDEVVSERALKHIQELHYIKKKSKTRCILCFVIQRTDVCLFQPSLIDATYRKAVQDAWKDGVEIIALQVGWNRNGECTLITDKLPIQLFDSYGPYFVEK